MYCLFENVKVKIIFETDYTYFIYLRNEICGYVDKDKCEIL